MLKFAYHRKMKNTLPDISLHIYNKRNERRFFYILLYIRCFSFVRRRLFSLSSLYHQRHFTTFASLFSSTASQLTAHCCRRRCCAACDSVSYVCVNFRSEKFSSYLFSCICCLLLLLLRLPFLFCFLLLLLLLFLFLLLVVETVASLRSSLYCYYFGQLLFLLLLLPRAALRYRWLTECV